jgi:hypothetical protein
VRAALGAADVVRVPVAPTRQRVQRTPTAEAHPRDARAHTRRYENGFKPNFQEHLKPVLAPAGTVGPRARVCVFFGGGGQPQEATDMLPTPGRS